MALVIGLMSGTSMDGVDAVLAALGEDEPFKVLTHRHLEMHAALRERLMALNESGPDELHQAALAANGMAALYADAVDTLLAAAGVDRHDVSAIGAHGQTVRHRPGEFDGTGYTLQLLNGAALAERTGIDVVCDFRSRDVAAGGQGAPLVPAFHAALWSRPNEARAVLNVGGMANLSLLGADGSVGGFDCGPGNVLMDLWAERHLGRPYDDDGAWAAGGRVDARWLSHLLDEPYFRRSPPKSTGRDLFHADWLDVKLRSTTGHGLSAQDVQATLAELSARTAGEALLAHAPRTRCLLVCGGGALNSHLMRRLAFALPGVDVQSTEASGLPPLQVEASAFAWLAHAFMCRQPGNRPEVTGARGLRVLGALHPAG